MGMYRWDCTEKGGMIWGHEPPAFELENLEHLRTWTGTVEDYWTYGSGADVVHQQEKFYYHIWRIVKEEGWGNKIVDSAIFRCDLGGTNEERIVTIGTQYKTYPRDWNAYRFNVDYENDRIYCAQSRYAAPSSPQYRFGYYDISSGNWTTVVAGLTAYYFTMDWRNNRFWFTRINGDEWSLCCMDWDGSNVQTFLTKYRYSGPEEERGAIYDVNLSHMQNKVYYHWVRMVPPSPYVVDPPYTGGLYKMNIDGSNHELVVDQQRTAVGALKLWKGLERQGDVQTAT